MPITIEHRDRGDPRIRCERCDRWLEPTEEGRAAWQHTEVEEPREVRFVHAECLDAWAAGWSELRSLDDLRAMELPAFLRALGHNLKLERPAARA